MVWQPRCMAWALWKGCVGSKEHASAECVPSGKGQVGSSVLICLSLASHSEWEIGVRLWRRAGQCRGETHCVLFPAPVAGQDISL